MKSIFKDIDKIHGKWYSFFLENDGTKYTLTSSDLAGCSVSTTVLILPKGFHPIEFSYDIHAEGDKTGNFIRSHKIFADDQHGVGLPANGTCDYMTVYIFGYQDK